MIEYIKGEISGLTPTYVVLDVQGVGYGLNITLNTYSAIHDKEIVKLFVFESIREDAYTLYGFSTNDERKVFLLLITVSGVGANTARMILSELDPEELCDVIFSENVTALKSVKGIGLKTAQRIIVDLKDKIAALGLSDQDSSKSGTQVEPINKEVRDAAIGALTMLGFSPVPSAKVVDAILKENPDLPVEKVVKLALKQIK